MYAAIEHTYCQYRLMRLDKTINIYPSLDDNDQMALSLIFEKSITGKSKSMLTQHKAGKRLLQCRTDSETMTKKVVGKLKRNVAVF